MGGDGFIASLEDGRYAAQVQQTAPHTSDAPVDAPSPERTGVIWGSLFRAFPRAYTLFTGGLDQLAEVGETCHPIRPFGLPYHQGFTRPAMAGPQEFRPKLSAFTNKALGAADAGRNQTTRAPMPLPVERGFAVPVARFWDQFPSPGGGRRPFTPHFGYVTPWPQAQMQFASMGKGGQ